LDGWWAAYSRAAVTSMAMCIIIITATNAFELARYHCVKLIDIASVKRWQPVFDPKRTHRVPLTESAFVSRNNVDRIFRCVRRLFVVIGVFRTLPGFRFIFPVYILLLRWRLTSTEASMVICPIQFGGRAAFGGTGGGESGGNIDL
jgi:hypothetical protein